HRRRALILGIAVRRECRVRVERGVGLHVRGGGEREPRLHVRTAAIDVIAALEDRLRGTTRIDDAAVIARIAAAVVPRRIAAAVAPRRIAAAVFPRTD